MTPRTLDMPTAPRRSITSLEHSRFTWHNTWTPLEPYGFRARVCACALEHDHWEADETEQAA